jgi:hypothetical protein
MTSNILEDQLKAFLQRNVSFKAKTKILKKGRLILFNVIDFYIVFTIETAFSNKRQTYEIPFPFSIERVNEDMLVLDYRFHHLYNNNQEIKMLLNRQSKNCRSKYLDTEVILEAV